MKWTNHWTITLTTSGLSWYGVFAHNADYPQNILPWIGERKRLSHILFAVIIHNQERNIQEPRKKHSRRKAGMPIEGTNSPTIWKLTGGGRIFDTKYNHGEGGSHVHRHVPARSKTYGKETNRLTTKNRRKTWAGNGGVRACNPRTCASLVAGPGVKLEN